MTLKCDRRRREPSLLCAQALREDVVTFSQVLVQQYEQAYRTGDVPSFPQSPKSKDVPNKIEKSIELWCCVVPNEANYLAEGPGSVRVRDESSVEIQAGQETLPFEFDLVTQLTRDISGHNDPSFRKWQVIVNQQLRRGPGRAACSPSAGPMPKTALLEGSGVGVARIGVGIMSHTMRHLCQLYQGQVEITISCIEVYDGEARDLLSTDAATSTANPARNVHLDRSQKIMLQRRVRPHILQQRYSSSLAAPTTSTGYMELCQVGVGCTQCAPARRWAADLRRGSSLHHAAHDQQLLRTICGSRQNLFR